MTITQGNSARRPAAGAQQRAAVVVERVRVVRATPEAIFALLSEPQNLSAILPRVSKVEVLRRDQGSARVRTHMAMGPLGTLKTEGDVRWVGGRELSFRATQPALVETSFTLTPAAGGTQISVTMALDLTPMMGPLAAFIPQDSVAMMAGPDLDATLASIAKRVEA